MADLFKDRILGGDKIARYKLVRENGSLAEPSVELQLVSNVVEAGDAFGAKHVNLLLKKETGGLLSSLAKKSATIVVGIGKDSEGHRAGECDYLCDGVDDQVEINAAIAALPSTGGKILLREGTYNLTKCIAMNRSNVTLQGMGDSTVLKRMYDQKWEGNVNGDPGSMVQITGSYNTIKDMFLDGNNAKFKGTGNYGMILDAVSHITIRGMMCKGHTTAIYLGASHYNIITENECYENSGMGIFIFGQYNTIANNRSYRNGRGIGAYGNASNNGTNYNTITGNVCTENAYQGIWGWQYCYENTISGNTCGQNGWGIVFGAESKFNTFTANNCCYNKNVGIELGGTGSERVNANSVTGNTCYNNATGIRLSNASFNTVSGNTCTRGSASSGAFGSAEYSILVENTSTSNLISSNNLSGKNIVVLGDSAYNITTGNLY